MVSYYNANVQCTYFECPNENQLLKPDAKTNFQQGLSCKISKLTRLLSKIVVQCVKISETSKLMQKTGITVLQNKCDFLRHSEKSCKLLLPFCLITLNFHNITYFHLFYFINKRVSFEIFQDILNVLLQCILHCFSKKASLNSLSKTV